MGVCDRKPGSMEKREPNGDDSPDSEAIEQKLKDLGYLR